MSAADSLSVLRTAADAAARRAHAPYSHAGDAAAVLLADGTLGVGVRLENASFPVTLPAWQTAWARARLHSSADVAACCISAGSLHTAGAHAFLSLFGKDRWARANDTLLVRRDAALPAHTTQVAQHLDGFPPADDTEGLRLALNAAEQAVCPASHFPVGCVIQTTTGALVWGANVELEIDWTRGLCAERLALAALLTDGLGEAKRIFLACPKAPAATPCGACRQVIAEVAPSAPVVHWRGDNAPEIASSDELLPGAFRGDSLPPS